MATPIADQLRGGSPGSEMWTITPKIGPVWVRLPGAVFAAVPMLVATGFMTIAATRHIGAAAVVLVLGTFPASFAIFGGWFAIFYQHAALILTPTDLTYRRPFVRAITVPRAAVGSVVVVRVTPGSSVAPRTFVLDHDGRQLLTGPWQIWSDADLSELWRRLGVVPDQRSSVISRGVLYGEFPGIRWMRRFATWEGVFVVGTIGAILGVSVAWAWASDPASGADAALPAKILAFGVGLVVGTVAGGALGAGVGALFDRAASRRARIAR